MGKPECVERLDVRVMKDVGLGFIVRIAAPKEKAAAFCAQLRDIVETDVSRDYSPVQVEISPVIDRFWIHDSGSLKRLESMLTCKVEVLPAPQDVAMDGLPPDTASGECKDSSEAMFPEKGKGKGRWRRVPRGEEVPRVAENRRMLVSFARGLEQGEQDSACDILRILCNVSPAFTYQMPREPCFALQ